MRGFRTKRSLYVVDTFNKTITGGYFGDAIYPYESLQAIIGTKAIIRLCNGQVIKTGIVQCYI